jgi:hypothetical protein
MTALNNRFIEDLQLQGSPTGRNRPMSARCGCWLNIFTPNRISSRTSRPGSISCTSRTPERPLELLRQYWLTHRHPVWLFPAGGAGPVQRQPASALSTSSTLQKACRLASRGRDYQKL